MQNYTLVKDYRKCLYFNFDWVFCDDYRYEWKTD